MNCFGAAYLLLSLCLYLDVFCLLEFAFLHFVQHFDKINDGNQCTCMQVLTRTPRSHLILVG